MKDLRTVHEFVSFKDETQPTVENTVIQCFIYTAEAPRQPTYVYAMMDTFWAGPTDILQLINQSILMLTHSWNKCTTR